MYHSDLVGLLCCLCSCESGLLGMNLGVVNILVPRNHAGPGYSNQQYELLLCHRIAGKGP